ncbi:MAG TPA: GNAT family N-acetyltransferase [Phycisphaerae bacterium]|nr:GNAT family N-acetyltransferase [Phycisphaerae bacterium]
MPGKPPSAIVLYNAPAEAAAGGYALESEAGVLAEVEAVAAALKKLRVPHRIAGVRCLGDVPAAVLAGDERVVFNLVEGFDRRSEEANWVPAACRALGRGVTGNGSECLAIALDKWRSKVLLQAAGLPVPAAVRVAPGGRVRRGELPPGPYIVKPASADASEGIHADRSIVARAGAALDRAVSAIHRQFAQAALVEQFIAGRELNVSLLEQDGEVRVVAIAEIDFSAFAPGKPRIVDYAAKWLAGSFEYHNTPRVLPAPLDRRTAARVAELAVAAWEALGCADYVRVDFRLDEAHRPFVIEVNPNPDIAPDAGFAAALAHAGIRYEQFVRNSLANALAQCPAPTRRRARREGRGERGGKSPAVAVRPTRPGDRDEVLRFLVATGAFLPGEVAIAAEVLDDALAKGSRGGYESLTAELDGRATGWVCFGPTACTVGTFDVYWIAVAPDAQRRGIGAALLTRAEQRIAEQGGRLAVVETSSRPRYDPTREFYRRAGYREAARVAAFYAPDDDKIICTKPIAARAPAAAGPPR